MLAGRWKPRHFSSAAAFLGRLPIGEIGFFLENFRIKAAAAFEEIFAFSTHFLKPEFHFGRHGVREHCVRTLKVQLRPNVSSTKDPDNNLAHRDTAFSNHADLFEGSRGNEHS